MFERQKKSLHVHSPLSDSEVVTALSAPLPAPFYAMINRMFNRPVVYTP